MGMNLYYGGYGDYNALAVAENEREAIKAIGVKINAPFLPVTANLIDSVDGYSIRAVSQHSEPAGHPENTMPDRESDESCESGDGNQTSCAQTKFKCKQCGLEFDSLAELGRHAKKEHPKKGE